MRARSSTARLLHVLAFHNFPAAPPLKTTRENLSAYTEGNHTCSLPTAVQLELNRIKSTAVPSVPPLFPRQMNVSRLSFTWSALEVKLGQHRCARGQGTAIALAPSSSMLLLPRYRVVNTAVPDFSASAIALAPYGPMLSEPRGQRRHQLQVRPDQVVVGGLEALARAIGGRASCPRA